MPKFYHVHRGICPSDIEDGFEKERLFYFARKNSLFYKAMMKFGKEHDGGYIIYEINIPNNRYTESFNPKSEGKIVRITNKNYDQYHNLFRTRKKPPIKELMKKGIFGIDATSPYIRDEDGCSPLEGFVFDYHKTKKEFSVRVVEIYDTKRFTEIKL